MATQQPNEARIALSGAENGGGAIVFDPDRIRQPEAAWFDPDHWGEAARPVDAGGRGSAWFVCGPFGEGVLRHYRRGGWAARISHDRYLWQDEASVRSVVEFRLTARLHALGLPVPAPLAAAYWRTGAGYRAAILVQRLPGVRSLAQLIHAQDTWPWEAAGAAIARFHRQGLDHVDLNAHNILIDALRQAWLIDFDRCRLRPAPGRWQQRNLDRLLRSLRKLRGNAVGAAVDARFEVLQHAYRQAGAPPA